MEYPISESEYRFIEILWEEESISSMIWFGFFSERLNWKKSTTYTVIRKLSEKNCKQRKYDCAFNGIMQGEMLRNSSYTFRREILWQWKYFIQYFMKRCCRTVQQVQYLYSSFCYSEK
ncbi:MAG: BlaI/MecI/CopY family transcriptional regulator [Eubacterium sp.]|nr:BlaI/MecI/CopY family transcriptional regulator [Eubacterium sp.]